MPADAPRLRRAPGPRPGIGIVHLGLGAFFRAHGAIYIAEAMAKSGGDWGITGVSLVRPDQRDALAPQDFAYTAVELGPDGAIPRVIDVVGGVLVAPEDPEAVLAAIADPGDRIVTLTVTENGYCHEPATGRLDPDHPAILADLANPEPPRWRAGFSWRPSGGGARRAGAFTVLCSDNMPANGHVLRGVTLELARLARSRARGLDRGRRPPSLDDGRPDRAGHDARGHRGGARATGLRDLWPVLHEPFRQWVMEDHFVDGARPDLGGRRRTARRGRRRRSS